jgi:O-antigen/teichoic acid export membrane protein
VVARDASQAVSPAPAKPLLGLPARFARNVSTNYVAAGLSAVAGVFVTPLLLHHLGERDFGVWALALSLIAYLEVLELGFGAACTKLMADDARKRPDDVSRTLSTSVLVLSGTGLLALFLGLGLAAVAPALTDVPTGLESTTRIVIAVLAVAVALSIPGDAFGGGLAAYQRYDLRSLSNTILVALTTASTFVLVLSGNGLIAVALGTAICSVVMHPVRWAMLRRVDPDLHLSVHLISRRSLSLVSRVSGWFLLADVAAYLSYTTDLVLVGAVLGIKAVALYAIGSKLALLAQKALNEASTVLLPEAATISRNGLHSAMAALLLDGTRLTMLIGIPLSLLTTILAGPAIRAWVGRGYDGSIVVLIVLTLDSAFRTIANPAESIVIGAGRVRTYALWMTVQAVVNVAITLTLIFSVGISGPAIGTLVGTALIITPAFVIISGRVAGLSIATFLRGAVLPHLAPAVIAGVVLLLGRHLAGEGRLQLVLVASAGLVAYALAYLWLSANDAERDKLRLLVGRIVPNQRTSAVGP